MRAAGQPSYLRQEELSSHETLKKKKSQCSGTFVFRILEKSCSVEVLSSLALQGMGIASGLYKDVGTFVGVRKVGFSWSAYPSQY